MLLATISFQDMTPKSTKMIMHQRHPDQRKFYRKGQNRLVVRGETLNHRGFNAARYSASMLIILAF